MFDMTNLEIYQLLLITVAVFYFAQSLFVYLFIKVKKDIPYAKPHILFGLSSGVYALSIYSLQLKGVFTVQQITFYIILATFFGLLAIKYYFLTIKNFRNIDTKTFRYGLSVFNVVAIILSLDLINIVASGNSFLLGSGFTASQFSTSIFQHMHAHLHFNWKLKVLGFLIGSMSFFMIAQFILLELKSPKRDNILITGMIISVIAIQLDISVFINEVIFIYPVLFMANIIEATRINYHLLHDSLTDSIQLNSIVNNSDMGIALITIDGNIITWNPAAESILGYTLKDFEEFNLKIIDIAPDELKPELPSLINKVKNGENLKIETERLHKDGSRVPIFLSLTPVKDNYGQTVMIAGMFSDLSEKKSITNKLLHSERLANLGQMAANVGHEINNPMTVILGVIPKIKKQLVSANLDTKYLDKQLRASERITDIVKSLRVYSRSEPQEETTENIHLAIEEALDFFNSVNTEHDLNITTQFSAKRGVVKGNHSRLQQVIINLLSNAAAGVKSSKLKNISIVTKNADDYIYIEVIDSGIGIPKEFQSKVFEPFFTTKRVGDGTGLGLDICRAIVKEMKGNINLVPSPNQGSFFRVSLPLAEDCKNATDLENNKVQPEQNFAGTALVVEDDPEVCDYLCEILEGYGLDVDKAHNGVEALKLIEAKNYNKIYTDLEMPEMNGGELILNLNKLKINSDIFIVTGGAISTFSDDDKDLIEKTISDYIYKPFSHKDILKSIEV